MPVSEIRQVAIGKLRPNSANSRTHAKRQVEQIAASIRTFGFTAPIIVDESRVILAGHGRWLAAKELGLKHVPVITVAGLSEAQRRAYLLADNKLTENAGWDRSALAIELNELAPLLAEEGLCIELTGEALHPEHESIATLEKLRREVGSDIFAAQYQQCPVPPGGAMIKRAWLRYYDTAPERPYQAKVFQSWDTAAKAGAQNDWSVCTTWMVLDKHYYLLDVTRGRYEYPRLRDTALALAERFKPTAVLIEDASTGIALAQELRQGARFNVKPIPVERDKVGRLFVQQAKFEAGLVLFPKGASFLPELEAELLAFPHGKTDDQVDSISQALAYQGSTYDSTYRWV